MTRLRNCGRYSSDGMAAESALVPDSPAESLGYAGAGAGAGAAATAAAEAEAVALQKLQPR